MPLGKLFKGAYKVPNLYYVFKNKFLVRQAEVPHFVVPGHVVEALFAYANRASDEGYKFHELATYASGLKRRIVIGSQTVQDHWDVTAGEYNRIVFSIFVLGAISRLERTQGVSAIFAHLKSTGCKVSWFGNFFRNVERFFTTRRNDELELMGDYIWQYHVIKIRDLVLCNTVKVVCDAPLTDYPTIS